MRAVVAYIRRWWDVIGSALLGIASTGLDVAGITVNGRTVRWEWVTLVAFVLFVGVAALRLHNLDVQVLDNANRDECLTLISNTIWSVRDTKDQVAQSRIWDQQVLLASNASSLMQSTAHRLRDDFNRPSLADHVILLIVGPIGGFMDVASIVSWLDRMESSLDEAREDVWKGRR